MPVARITIVRNGAAVGTIAGRGDTWAAAEREARRLASEHARGSERASNPKSTSRGKRKTRRRPTAPAVRRPRKKHYANAGLAAIARWRRAHKRK